MAPLPSMYEVIHWTKIARFDLLYVIQNLWRPLLNSRFDALSEKDKAATILSIESQAKSISTMSIAPPLGLTIDVVKNYGIGITEFWPMGALGVMIALGIFLTARHYTQEKQ